MQLTPQRSTAPSMAGGQAMRLVESRAEEPSSQAAPSPDVREAPTGPAITSLADIAALADANRDMAFKVLVRRCVRLVRVEPGRLTISVTEEAPKTLLTDLTGRLQKWTGRPWLVALSRETGGQTLAEADASRRETALLDAQNDPTVVAILARFPGAKIIDVRIPNAPEAEPAAADMAIEPAPDEDEPN
jgi:DNA polymerase-3 subunit gamma/tau